MGISLRNIGKKITDFGSRAYDQVNMLDNNRTYKQRTATTNRSNLEQITRPVVRTVQPISTGFQRSVAGLGESVSGLYDLATPGLGTNRFTKNFTIAGQLKDIEAKDKQYSPFLYKTGQFGGEAAQLLATSGVTNLVKGGQLTAKGATTVVPKVLPKATSVVGKTVQFLKKPGVAANIASNVAQNSGFRTARGIENTPQAVALDTALSVAVPAVASVAGQQIVSGAKKTIGAIVDNPRARSKYKDAVTQYLTNKQAMRVEREALSAQKTATGMSALNRAEAGANFSKDINAPKPLALPQGSQNFTIPALEDKRIMDGLEAMAANYDKESANIVKVWASSPNRLNAELEKLDQKYLREHSDLLNGVGNYAVQTPKESQIVKPKIRIKEPTTDPKLLDIKISKVKDPARKAELIAERDALNAVKPKVTQKIDVPGLEPISPYTSAPKAPGVFKRAWASVNGVISEHGTGGKEIAKRISEARNLSELGQQEFIQKIPTVFNLRKEFTTFVQALEKLSKGEQVNVSPKVQKAIQEWNQAIPEIRQRAINAGLEVGDLGPNYFPRQYKDLFKGDKGLGRMAEQMIKDAQSKGKDLTLGEAIGQLQFMKKEYQKPFGNLEKTRMYDLPGYEQTPEALVNYISRSYDRISKAEQLGSKNEILNELLGRVQQEGFDATPNSILDKNIKIALGDVNKNTTGFKVSSAIRNVNAVRSLSTAAVSNATQLVNTATTGGIGRTVKNAFKILTSKEAREAAKQTAVTLDHSINDLAQQGLGTKGKVMSNIASPFFRQVEKFNREVTALVGGDFGDHLAKKGDIDTLRNKFGITGEIGSKLTDTQKIQMARKLVEISQFKVDPMDLPGWVDSPMGKIVAQFRTFGYKQTGFVYNEVLREAIKGNLLPLTRFVALGVPLGAGSQYIKSKIKGTEYTSPNENKGLQAAKAMAAVGVGGLPGDIAQNLYKSSKFGDSALVGSMAGIVGGPTTSLAVETTGNIGKGISNGNWKPLQKEAVRNLPLVGQPVANRAFPKTDTIIQAPKQGETPTLKYLNDESKKKKEELTKNLKEGDFLLDKLPNGKYAYTVKGDSTIHESASLEEARLAQRKATFKESDAKSKVIGDTYFYKEKDGDIKTKPKVMYEFEQKDADQALALDRYKRAKDYEGWAKTAQERIASLESKKALYDPETENDEIVKITNQQEDLLAQLDKYAGYGGSFTKGKGGSGGSKSAGSQDAYKYALSTTSGGNAAPKVGFRVANKSVRVARRQATKPSVSIRKSKV